MPVHESPDTRASLLIRLRDGTDVAAWREFVDVYGPLIYSFARKRGLQDADAADLMQDVLRSVSGAIGRLDYDRKLGTFRGWLFSITRNKVYNFLSAGRGKARGVGDTDALLQLAELPDETPGAEQDWEAEYQRRLAAIAMDRVKPEFQETTWQAFWETSVAGVSAADVGRALGMSTGAVYVAKSRVLARLRDVVARLQAEEEDV